MDEASNVLFALKPESFRYNKEYRTTQTTAFGLIAEEVADVAADLVGCNPQGQPESVRYYQINAMLLNEFFKEQRKVQKQQQKIDSLKAELREQRELIQKIGDRLEITKSAPQMVSNDRRYGLLE
jgi:hypothetical protein